MTVSALVASGYHAPILVAIPIVVAVVLAKLVYSKSRGRPALGGKLIVRWSKGHLFTTNWSPLGSLTSVRLGDARFQRCPVGDHWALVRSVNDADLTEEDRRVTAAHGG